MVSVKDVPRWIFLLAIGMIQFIALLYFAWAAYQIRLYPIKDFGHVIHEFDPWFNYRATEYLAQNGLTRFYKWYDYMSWYPIGRPIGTTIYPGMQLTAVFIWDAQKWLPSFSLRVPPWVRKLASRLSKSGLKYLSLKDDIPKIFHFKPMSVNDICCMIPPWFGAVASIFCGLLAYEVSRSGNAMVMTTGVMSIIPAHLQRSIGGKFDNECVAMAAICSTFWLWLRSVRTVNSWPYGIFTGLSYAYMVAAWGGYIFVINMIGVHALILVLLGRFHSGVYKAYTLFFIIGTFGALQVPVVGLQPLRSVEQLGPLGVFFGYQLLMFCDACRRSQQMTTPQFVKFRVMAFICSACVLAIGVLLLIPTGYFGPISSRIRGLFLKHTKTGNPLVDSVAEHQPANARIYEHHLNVTLDYAVYGALVSVFNRNNGFYFAALYIFVASHFSGKMARLVLICAPICSMMCGIWLGFLLDFLLRPFLLLLGGEGYCNPLSKAIKAEEEPNNTEKESHERKSDGKKQKRKPTFAEGEEQVPRGKHKKKAMPVEEEELVAQDVWPLEEWEENFRTGGMMDLKRRVKLLLYDSVSDSARNEYFKRRTSWDQNKVVLLSRAIVSILIMWYLVQFGGVPEKVASFVKHCDGVAVGMSTTTVIFKARHMPGEPKIDDYFVGYKWIEKNTPADSRVMAWWDYGYQITGIANRTSIADGNTWNHEHIATLGKMLTSSQKRAHNAIRHLADYVLVWAGQGGDLGKSPHLARIGNSVFPDHCGDDDPKCMKFGFYNNDQNNPTPMMKQSLLYNLVKHARAGSSGPMVNQKYFKEVYTTAHGLMRVFKVMNVSEASKAWIADPKNRVCDAPGSWYCVGQYPPALAKLIAQRRSFSQLEDFNKKGGKSAYTKLVEKERAKEL